MFSIYEYFNRTACSYHSWPSSPLITWNVQLPMLSSLFIPVCFLIFTYLSLETWVTWEHRIHIWNRTEITKSCLQCNPATNRLIRGKCSAPVSSKGPYRPDFGSIEKNTDLGSVAFSALLQAARECPRWHSSVILFIICIDIGQHTIGVFVTRSS